MSSWRNWCRVSCSSGGNDETRMTNDEIVGHHMSQRGSSEGFKATADFAESFWDDGSDASCVIKEDTVTQNFDLEERTALFGEAIIKFAKRVPRSPVNNRLIDQIVGVGTSTGANYCEADDAVSKKEFVVNINRCRKESREAKFFLRMIATAEPSLKAEARSLWKEARELNLIFSAIVRNTRAALHAEASASGTPVAGPLYSAKRPAKVPKLDRIFRCSASPSRHSSF